jgi:catechol 1,2-dioxygenase
MASPPICRRSFVQAMLLEGAALATASTVVAQGDEAPAAKGPATKAIRKKVKPLPPTRQNIEGPFYRPGAPFRTRLFEDAALGDVLSISGKVLGTDGRPLTGAVLDVWQASLEGRYDNGDPDHPPPEGQFQLRGRIKTDEEGNYKLQTVRPGAYKLTPLQYRPPHIHLKVTASGYRDLTTQFFFRGDPYNKLDPWFKPELALNLQPEGKIYVASFDIVLPKT